MNIALITLMKNKADLTIALLDSIRDRSDFWKKPGNKLDIVIGDTGSDPEDFGKITKYIEHSPLSIKQYEIGEYNFAKNNNQLAIPYKGTDYLLLFCNNDIELVNDAISVIADTYRKLPDTGTLGARLMFPDGTVQHCGVRHVRKNGKLQYVAHLYYKKRFDEDFFSGGVRVSCGNTAAFMAVSSSIFWLVSGFNEEYRKCFEDVEFNSRIAEAGYRNRTCFDAVAVHKESSTRTTEQDPGDIERTVKRLSRKPKAALVCIARDEDEHLKEWLDYHLKLGFSRIFVFMNDWRSDLAGKYSQVEFRCADGRMMQCEVYNYFISTFNRDFDFAMFMDCDEFLCLKEDENISKFCSRFKDFNAVGINWRMFGEDSPVELPYGYSVVDTFRKCQPVLDKHVKTMLNFMVFSTRKAKFINPHFVDLAVVNDFTISTDSKMYIHGPFNETAGNSQIAQINHYYKRTKREFAEKIAKGKADTDPNHPEYRHNWDLFNKYYGYTTVDNTAAEFKGRK